MKYGVKYAAMMMALLAGPAQAWTASSSAARLAAFAKLPDWSGLWQLDGAPGTLDPGPAVAAPAKAGPPNFANMPERRDYPPYNAAWEAKYTANRKLSQTISDTNTRYCAAGFPRLLASPFVFDLAITPEEAMIHYAQREIRHVWTDGRGHPPADELWPLDWGDSIGHWQGDTLVIDTISIKGSMWLDPTAATLSDSAHITERMTRISADELQDQITIEDPVAFTKAWKFTRNYKRVTDTNRILDDDCYENPRITVGADNKYQFNPTDPNEAK